MLGAELFDDLDDNPLDKLVDDLLDEDNTVLVRNTLTRVVTHDCIVFCVMATGSPISEISMQLEC